MVSEPTPRFLPFFSQWSINNKKAKVTLWEGSEVISTSLEPSNNVLLFLPSLPSPAPSLTSTPTAFPLFDDLSYTLDWLLLFCFLFGHGVWLVKSFFFNYFLNLFLALLSLRCYMSYPWVAARWLLIAELLLLRSEGSRACGASVVAAHPL